MRVSSRLARRQEEKLKQQAMMMTVLSVVIGLVFIFFILPLSVNFFFKLLGGTEVVEENTIPPQTPVFQTPPQAIKQNPLSVSGFAESGSQVVLVVNAEEADRTEVGQEGSFSFEVDLQEGENKLTAFAVSLDDKTESNLSREYVVILDSQVPILQVETPLDGQQIELRANQLLTIKGQTEPRAKVTINGRLTNADREGVFSTTLQLQEGDNLITITAEDLAGNKSESELSVHFRF